MLYRAPNAVELLHLSARLCPIRLYPFKVLCIFLPYDAFYSKLPGSRRLISMIRTMSRKKIILSARVANDVFLPFPCPSPSSTIPCYLCMHHQCVMLQTICKLLKQLWEAVTKTSTSALQATRVEISA